MKSKPLNIIEEAERLIIMDALEKCYGQRTLTAQYLGINIRTLRNKIKTYEDLGYKVKAPQDGKFVLRKKEPG